MSRSRRLLLAAPLALLAACSNNDECGQITCPEQGARARLYVVNAARDLGDLQVWVDDAIVWDRVEPVSGTGTIWLSPGPHTVAIVPRGGGSADDEFTVDVNADRPRLVVATSRNGEVAPMIVADTGSVVPEGATKLRVVHSGAAGIPAVDVWRTQPDFATNVRVMTPFAAGATSTYLQSTPGTWTVTVTPRDSAASAPANPLATASIGLAAGQRASVVLVAGRTAGTVDLVTVRER